MRNTGVAVATAHKCEAYMTYIARASDTMRSSWKLIGGKQACVVLNKDQRQGQMKPVKTSLKLLAWLLDVMVLAAS